MDTTVIARPLTDSRYAIGLATAADDADLRRLLRETPMPGPIEVSLEREPDFFAAARQEGGRHHTVAIRDRLTGRLAAMGSRSVYEMFVDGQPQRVGYLSQLRIAPEHRRPGRQLLRIGFDLLRQTHVEGEASFDITTIVEGNETARRILEADLPGLPRYQKLEEFVTFLLPVRGRLRAGRRGVEVANGSALLLPAILECLERFGRRHQFAWHWTTTNILPPERFYVALAGSHIAGCLALWDQRAFKQVVIRGYDRTMTWRRPLLNLLGARLPAVGEPLAHAHLSHVAVDDDDPQVLAALLAAAIEGARQAKLDCVTIGFAARHPLSEVVRRCYRCREYVSILYAVHFDQLRDQPPALDGRIPHPEVAVL
jgi:hypothetical protein